MRFVLLHHTGWAGRADHFDLMLQMEAGEDDSDPVLKTFASLTDAPPDGKSHSDTRARGAASGDPNSETNLLRLIDDHRRAYLTLEGPLSGNRGQVARVDEGTLDWLEAPDTALQLLRFKLDGRRLKGSYRLRHMGGGIYSFERLKRV